MQCEKKALENRYVLNENQHQGKQVTDIRAALRKTQRKTGPWQ